MQGFKNRIKILYFARFNQLFALREVTTVRKYSYKFGILLTYS